MIRKEKQSSGRREKASAGKVLFGNMCGLFVESFLLVVQKDYNGSLSIMWNRGNALTKNMNCSYAFIGRNGKPSTSCDQRTMIEQQSRNVWNLASITVSK